MKLDMGPGLNAMRIPALALAVVAIANVAALFWVTLPAWDASAAAGSAGAMTQQAQAAIVPELERARRVYGGVASAEASLATLRQRVGASSGTAADVVSTLRAAVDAAGVRADRITYQTQPVAELGLTQLQVNLPVRGDYRGLRRLLDALFDGPMFVVVERVSASTPSQSDPTGELMLGLAASVFLDPTRARPEHEEVAPFAAESEGAAPAPVADPVAAVEALVSRLRGLPEIPLSNADFQLALGRLDMRGASASASRRDLFSVVQERPAQPSRAVQRRRERAQNFTPEPVMPYDLIGVTRTNTGLVATLVDGDLVLTVREGQVLPDGYRVAAVETMSVTLEAGAESTKIPLRPADED
ncbi:MAG: hypothetical protein GKS06_04295 [Acidobacteria bacterium]|nr:hypothetical protein [Acidobacteriota bacterium]